MASGGAVKDKAESPGRRQRPKNYLSNIDNGFDLRRELLDGRFYAGLERHLIDAARDARAFEANGNVLVVFDRDQRDVAAVGFEERADFFERFFYVGG